MQPKKIKSEVYLRGPDSRYIKDRCSLIKVFQLLGIIREINMRKKMCLDGELRWSLIVTCEVNRD